MPTVYWVCMSLKHSRPNELIKMTHNSVTPCYTAAVSTVCTAVLLCLVTFTLFHHQTAAEDMLCAVGCRCYNYTANCSHIGLGFVSHWDSFRIGLHELDFTGNSVESLDERGLIGYDSVRNMSFRNNKIRKVDPLAFQGMANGLMYLDLSGNTIHTIDSTTFSFIPELQVLLISNNSIAVLDSTVFGGLTKLRQLDLSFNYLSQVPEGTFDENLKLEFLSLRHNHIDRISKVTFRTQQNMKHLDLSHNKISVIVQDAFLALQHLEWLSLAHNNIKEISTNLCENVKQVLHLNLSGNIIDCINPLSFSQCSRLETLSIAHNSVSELPQQALYGIFSLTQLDLSHNKLTHFGPEVFVDVTSDILSTQLHHNSTFCPHNQSLYRDLKLLKLNNNQISSLDRCVFAPVSSLQVVDMSANRLSALDYRIFLQLKNFSSFDISWNRLSTVDGGTAQWLLDTGTDSGTAVNFTGNPWLCDCDRMYRVYRKLQEGRRQSVTLRCENPAELRGELWDVLEDRCKPTVTPPKPATLPAVKGSIANTADVSTSQPVNFSNPYKKDVPVQGSSPHPSHSPTTFLIIFVACFAAAVFVAVVVISITIRRLRSPSLNFLWWEDVVSRRELMSK